MKLDTLLKELNYELVQGSLDTEVCAVENDSRKVTDGALFFCIAGAVFDGHTYAADVADKGASVIVVEKDVDLQGHADVTVVKVKSTRYAMGVICSAFYGEPSKKLTVVGITGTKGKTTTTYMIKSMLEAAGHKTGLLGTIESIVGDKVTPASNTTPESIVMQRTLHEMVEAGLDSVVMEVSSQGLMLDRVAGIDFDYGIFTNLSEDHIGPNEHKDFAEYLGWKAKLFTLCKTGIFNVDDTYCNDILKGHTCDVITYGEKEGADYRAQNLNLYRKDGELGITYHLSGKYEEDVRVSLPGEFSVHNSLAAIAVAKEMGVPMEKILETLDKYPVSTRLSLKGTIIVGRDIAHAKIKERLDAGEPMPQYLKDHPIYYAGPAKKPEGMPSGSFGPTTAGRMDPYVDQFQAAGGSMVMIAKGNRSQQVTDACKKHGGFYLGSIGGPAAILAKNSIKNVELLEYPELGMEAIWKIEVEDFPAFILVDNKGNDFFKQIKPRCPLA